MKKGGKLVFKLGYHRVVGQEKVEKRGLRGNLLVCGS